MSYDSLITTTTCTGSSGGTTGFHQASARRSPGSLASPGEQSCAQPPTRKSALEDEGFDFSVLSEFRDRLVAAGLEREILDRLLGRLKELGLLGAGGRQRTDSTHVLAAIRRLSRLVLAGESVRSALEALAT